MIGLFRCTTTMARQSNCESSSSCKPACWSISTASHFFLNPTKDIGSLLVSHTLNREVGRDAGAAGAVTPGDGGEPAEVLPAGAVVIAESTKKADQNATGYETRYTMNGGDVTQDQKLALRVVLGVSPPESATDDEIFGSDKAQKIGAVWPINSAKAAENLITGDSDAIRGAQSQDFTIYFALWIL
jgi:hypothetical protein